MRYAYKIYSRFDGFTPAKLPSRMSGPRLRLGWRRYIDSVEEGDEIWVYFHGPHAFTNGVYAKGITEEIDYDHSVVWLRVTESSTTTPITSANDSFRVAQVVAPRYRQVFFLPDEIVTIADCTLLTTAQSCARRLCGSCKTWSALPIVNRRILRTPHRLSGHVDAYAPAYWVVPNRSFLYREGTIRRGIEKSSNLFYRFKAGDPDVAFPLALGMHKALARAHRLDFDLVVPVPLSPDKLRTGELHRTLSLARELAKLLGGPPVAPSALSLTGPISKRRLRTQHGLTAAAFEGRYYSKLLIEEQVCEALRVLLVDDVCTEGSTLRMCAQAIRSHNPAAQIVAGTAGQMAVRQVVSDASSLVVGS